MKFGKIKLIRVCHIQLLLYAVSIKFEYQFIHLFHKHKLVSYCPFCGYKNPFKYCHWLCVSQ